MTDAPYTIPEGRSIRVEEQNDGNTRTVRMDIIGPDGTVERTFTDTRPMWPSWMDENEQ
jgi:hypothetical protein